MELNDIKLVISEVDGIVTEHLVAFGELNSVMFKEFYLKDFEAINLIKKNWGFVFLSVESPINMSLCKKRNIPFFHAERSKLEVYQKLLIKYNITPDNVLYIGSSYSDVGCVKMSGFSICPEDAVAEVKRYSDVVAPLYGGAGVLCYAYELLNNYRLNKNREE